MRPRFLLYGISNCLNRGCEAIIRGTAEMLRRQWPSCRITYVSFGPTTDRALLADTPVQVHRVTGRFRADNMVRKALHALHIRVPEVSRVPSHLLRACDCAMCIGGDNYGGRGRTLHFTDEVLRLGRPMVLWGCSLGPFDAGQRLALAPRLNRMALITAREPLTVEMLADLGVRSNVTQVADPAFLMEPATYGLPHIPTRRPLVAVNLSPNSTAHVFGATAVAHKVSQFAGAMDELVRRLDVNLLFVPHVFSAGSDDRAFLDAIRARMRTPERSVLLPFGLGARQIKGALTQCDVLCSARMHCAVAGISSATPTLLLAYSTKAQGMCRYVYGTDEWVLHLRDFDGGRFVNMVGGLLAARDGIRALLRTKAPQWRRDAERAVAALARVLPPDIAEGTP